MLVKFGLRLLDRGDGPMTYHAGIAFGPVDYCKACKVTAKGPL